MEADNWCTYIENSMIENTRRQFWWSSIEQKNAKKINMKDKIYF